MNLHIAAIPLFTAFNLISFQIYFLRDRACRMVSTCVASLVANFVHGSVVVSDAWEQKRAVAFSFFLEDRCRFSLERPQLFVGQRLRTSSHL